MNTPPTNVPKIHQERAHLPATAWASADSFQPGMTIEQWWAIIRAYQRHIVLLFSGLLLLSLLVIWLLPRTYTATASLVVNYEVNDPIGGREFPLALLASYSATQIEIMRSPQVLYPVIDELKLTEEREFIAGYDADKGTLHEWVRSGLNDSLDIQHSIGGSQLIHIIASSKNAKHAADIANATARVYLDQQVQRVNAPASDEAQRYATQIEELRRSVIEAQDRLIKFREQSGLITTEGGMDLELSLLSDIESRLLEARKLRIAAEARQGMKSGIDDQVLESPVVQSLKGQRALREAELAQLRTTLGPNHLRIKQLQSDIASIETAIKSEIDALDTATSADLVAVRELEKRLANTVAEQRTRVLGVRESEVEGAKYSLEFESVRNMYGKALDSFGQLKAAAGSRYSNVSLLSSATVPFKPTRPNKLKMLALALIASLGLAIGGPILYELFVARRIRCVDDVERQLGLLVLAEFLPADPPRAST